MKNRREFVAPRDSRRLDALLTELLPEYSRSQVARWIRDGQVTVGGVPVTKPSRETVRGESLVVDIPAARPLEAEAEALELDILYEDTDLLVVDKPAGMVVHPGPGNPRGTLVNALLARTHDLSGIGGVLRPGIVHRLDKDTSGLVVVAKNDVTHRALSAAFASREVEKVYAALVYGAPRRQSGTVDAPIRRDPRHRQRMAVAPPGDGRAALTRYRVVASAGGIALVECRPASGRTHQIRVHLASLGHPIVGDALYGGAQWRGIPDPRVRLAIKELGRQALHARMLSFRHPRSGEKVSFTAALPPDLRKVLQAVGLGDVAL